MDEPAQTIQAALEQRRERAGNDVFLRLLHEREPDKTLTYAELYAQAERWASTFAQHGLGVGDRILILAPHGIELYASFLGAVLGGFVPAMVHFPSPKMDRATFAAHIGTLVEQSAASLIVTFAQLKADLARLPGAPPILIIERVEPERESVAVPRVAAESTAFLQYSSGTTGLKKGVAISHAALLEQCRRYAAAIQIDETDCIVSWLPLYHDMGLVACFWLPLLTGTPIVAMSPFEWVRRPSMALEAITRYGGTLCWWPNFAFNHTLRSLREEELGAIDMSSMRGFVNCSEPVLAETHHRFLERLERCGVHAGQLWAAYAMAETTFAATSADDRDSIRYATIDAALFRRSGQATPASSGATLTLASSGTALSGTSIRIVDGEGNALGDGWTGEIVLRSSSAVGGYENDLAATQGSFRGGSYFTGDLGFLLDGHLYVTGRAKDLLIIAGKNVYPHDIESVVENVEGVLPGRSAALGLPDPETGTDKLLVIAETNGDGHGIAAAIVATVAAQTDVVVDEVFVAPPRWLRKSTSGKLARRASLERYLQENTPLKDESGSTGAKAELSIAGVRATLRTVLPPARHAQLATINAESPLITSGLVDSLMLVRFIAALEQTFDFVLPAEEQANLDLNFASLGAVLQLIQRLRTDDYVVRPLPRDEFMSIREWKTRDFGSRPRAIDTLILGNSRVMNMSARVASRSGRKAFNFAVSNARVEDFYCILCQVLDTVVAPLREVLISIDVDAFRNAARIDDRLLRTPELSRFLDAGDRAAVPEPTDRVAELLARQRDDAVWFRGYTYDPEYGDQVYLDSERHSSREPTVFEGDIESYNNVMTLLLDGFTELDAQRLCYFDALVRVAHEHGVQVRCFTTTLHPDLVAFISANTTWAKRKVELEATFAQRWPDVPLLDLSTPARFGGDDRDFADAGHMMPYNSDLALRALLLEDPVHGCR